MVYSTLRFYHGLFSVSMLGWKGNSSEYLRQYFILYWKKSMNMCISVDFNDRLNQINVIKMILFCLHKESGQIHKNSKPESAQILTIGHRRPSHGSGCRCSWKRSPCGTQSRGSPSRPSAWQSGKIRICFLKRHGNEPQEIPVRKPHESAWCESQLYVKCWPARRGFCPEVNVWRRHLELPQ